MSVVRERNGCHDENLPLDNSSKEDDNAALKHSVHIFTVHTAENKCSADCLSKNQQSITFHFHLNEGCQRSPSPYYQTAHDIAVVLKTRGINLANKIQHNDYEVVS